MSAESDGEIACGERSKERERERETYQSQP